MTCPEVDSARDEVMADVIALWDQSMRSILRALVAARADPGITSLIFRVFLEEQGLRYEVGSEWRFLEQVD